MTAFLDIEGAPRPVEAYVCEGGRCRYRTLPDSRTLDNQRSSRSPTVRRRRPERSATCGPSLKVGLRRERASDIERLECSQSVAQASARARKCSSVKDLDTLVREGLFRLADYEPRPTALTDRGTPETDATNKPGRHVGPPAMIV